MFFSVITKKLSGKFDIRIKLLLKDGKGLRMKNSNMGFTVKFDFEVGVMKTGLIYWQLGEGLPGKRGLDCFQIKEGGWQKRGGGFNDS